MSADPRSLNRCARRLVLLVKIPSYFVIAGVCLSYGALIEAWMFARDDFGALWSMAKDEWNE